MEFLRLRGLVAMFTATAARIDDSWIGDLLGCICLWSLGYGLWVAGCVVGL